MRALHLDYIATRAASPLAIAFFIMGLVLATLALLEYRAVRDELADVEARAGEVRKSDKRSAAIASQGPRDLEAAAQEVKLAQAALQRLALRWDALFVALESARANGVALLAIEPDPGKNVVKLTAEAKSAEDMLGYVERLQSAEGLADVTLASHQIKPSDPLQPLRFAVVAAWVKQP
jgi:hypothetical protein